MDFPWWPKYSCSQILQNGMGFPRVEWFLKTGFEILDGQILKCRLGVI
jgi:hypothetical protein